MKDLTTIKHFEPLEKLTTVLMQKTQNSNPLFFRILVAYYFAKVASMMRCSIATHERGVIPVNLYCINLATSGHGKGHSTNIMEEQVINQFRENFTVKTFNAVAEKQLARISLDRCAKEQCDDPNAMLEAVKAEFEMLGTLAFSFDSGTTPAVKQMRYKLLMANAGSVNFEMDEIGSNLLGNAEVLSTFLELYDVGKVKQKLTKNTVENKRGEDLEGRTPTNMMLFGTPSKLLDGEKVEKEFYAMLETGYARRCLFGYAKKSDRNTNLSALEVYDLMTDKNSIQFLDDISNHLGKLADPINFHRELTMSKDTSLELISYRLECEKKADDLKEHEDIRSAELSHRYYKALKLSGAYAFVDGSHEITSGHLWAAIKLVEESGDAFTKLLSRDRNYVRLANYIADVRKEVTQVDLVEDLPFYRGSESQKKDMMALAIAYGYKHNIIIKKSYSDGIEFFQGETLPVTDLNRMNISYSKDLAIGYKADYAPFDELYKVVCNNGYHYTAHHFNNGHRAATDVLEGFNLVIVDVDNGVNIQTAQMLLQGYKCMFATTKRHTDKNHRFRIIFPLSHVVRLNPQNYSKFMENVFKWLPFTVDDQTKDIARKWQAHNGQYHYQDGELLDAMLFIPQTKKEEEQAQKILDNESLSNLERWFFLNTDIGNRSNQIIRYALALVDSGYNIEGVRNSIHSFNSKLKDPLPDNEIDTTIMVTVAKAVAKRDMS